MYFTLHIQPLNMEQIKCSEMSAFNNQMPGKYPKDYTQYFYMSVRIGLNSNSMKEGLREQTLNFLSHFQDIHYVTRNQEIRD